MLLQEDDVRGHLCVDVLEVGFVNQLDDEHGWIDLDAITTKATKACFVYFVVRTFGFYYPPLGL